jgi:hypothetical protein
MGGEGRVERIGENEEEENENEGEEGGDEMEREEREHERKVKWKSKSKNFKISTDATCAMMEWLLVNFENPYPSTEEKQEMARKGKISMVKVNNWFINARERTVKGYFQKDG